MTSIQKLVRVQLLVLIVFLVFKLSRTSLLANEPAPLIRVFLYSLPNFCEGVIGTITLTVLGLYANQYLKVKNTTVYIIAVVLAGIYVVTQEFKIHNLGGNNIYDPNDVLFSVVGLIVGFGIVWLIKPQLMST